MKMRIIFFLSMIISFNVFSYELNESVFRESRYCEMIKSNWYESSLKRTMAQKGHIINSEDSSLNKVTLASMIYEGSTIIIIDENKNKFHDWNYARGKRSADHDEKRNGLKSYAYIYPKWANHKTHGITLITPEDKNSKSFLLEYRVADGGHAANGSYSLFRCSKGNRESN